MKNKKMLAMLLALTVTAAGTPVYAADFSDGNLESVQEAAEPEKILTGDTALEEDSNAQENQESDESGFTSAEETDEFTEEDVASAFTDDTENEGAEAQSSDTESGSEEETGTEGLEYEYDAELDGYRLVKGVNKKEIYIPHEYEGKEVKEIGEKAFVGCDQIESVQVRAYNVTIKTFAFESCSSLRRISFSGGVNVESYAFSNCPKLFDFVAITTNVTTNKLIIADDAFDSDSKVIVTHLGILPYREEGYPFFDENGEDELHHTYDQGLDYWYYKKWEGPSGYEGERVADFDNSVSKVRISNITDGIGRKAFYGSDKLEELWLGRQNYFIETQAFAECTNLKKIIIPETTTVIEENAFKNCPLLTIYTPKGSYAEKFAKSHQIPVQYIDDGINDAKLTLQIAERKKDEVTLKWDMSQLYFVDGYEIERKNLRGKYIHCSTIKSNDINTKNIDAGWYSMYYGKNITFRIRAYFIDENGTVIYSQPSNTVKTTFCPVQPKITSLTKKSGKKLTVRWKKSDYAIGYQVWRSVDGKKGVCIKTIKGGNVTSFTDTNLKEGATYIYWIKSYRMDYQKKKLYSRSNDYSKSIVY